MIYGKLPVVFLGVIASEKSGTTNSIIASYLLNHIDQVKHMGIKEIAAKCHVGVGSISRFCKEIGLQDFMELKKLLRSTEVGFSVCSRETSPAKRTVDYGRQVTKSIDLVTKSLSMQRLANLCMDIRRYEEVAVFGFLKAGSAAVNLQSDLWMQGKKVYTNVSYEQQIEYIRNAGKDTLILIFSYTGSYFEYYGGNLFSGRSKTDRPRIWIICGKQKNFPDYVTKVLDFQSLQDHAGHPYQLLYVAGLIAQEYGRREEQIPDSMPETGILDSAAYQKT